MAAAGRLTFLYPQLVRAATRGCSPTLGWATTVPTTTTTTAATTVRWNSLISKRHGKAVEPAEWEKQQQQQQQLHQQKQQEQDEQAKATQDKTATDTSTTEEAPAKAQAKSDIGKLLFESGEKKTSQAAATDAPETDTAALKSQRQDPKPVQTPADPKPSEPASAESEAIPIPMPPPKPQTESSDSTSTSTASAEPKADKPKDTSKMSDKLDSVYYMGAPESLASSSTPSMSPPKYVHHFDTYSLVKQLQEGGYSSDQATTMMKAVRALLAHNLDMAQEKLVSKSDVENVGTLFNS